MSNEITAALSLANPDGNRNEQILADLRSKHRIYGLTAKQESFALSLAEKLRNPEKHVTAPVGKAITFDGRIVSVKLRSGFLTESRYGDPDLREWSRGSSH